MIGTLLKDRYRIDAKLGEGGMGVVYKAHDTLLDRPVAIKALAPDLLTANALKRLQREAQSAARLAHPGVVAIYDVLDDGDRQHIVMEFVEGKTLRDLIPMPWRDAAGIMAQVFEAMDCAHSREIIHRDLKPDNIIVTAEGRAKVMDFGLARSEGRSRLTQTGMVVGTALYMAPEQALQGKAGSSSDLYALGCVFYELITGHPPFSGEDPISVITQHLNLSPRTPKHHVPDLPPALEALIVKLLAKDPKERPSSAAAVARMLSMLEAPRTAMEAAIAAGPSPGERLRRTRLVGRRDHLRRLAERLDGLMAGSGGVALVSGEPGIGKTRLLDEMVAMARMRGLHVLTGRCHETDTAIPYLPIADALEAFARGSAPETWRRLVQTAGPELHAVLSDSVLKHFSLGSAVLRPETSTLLAVQADMRPTRALRNLLNEVAKEAPVLIVIDDLHWADPPSLELIHHLALHTREMPMLVLGAYREIELDRGHPLSRLLVDLNRERLLDRERLRRLSVAETGEFLTHLLGGAPPDGLAELMHEQTEGNPFFIEELVNGLVEEERLVPNGQSGRHKLAPGVTIEGLAGEVPQGIRAAIGARLDRLDPTAQQVLGFASVIGRYFSMDVLIRLARGHGLTEEDVERAVARARAAQFIFAEDVPADRRDDVVGFTAGAAEIEADHAFDHLLIQQAVYSELDRRRRRRLHAEVGHLLEAIHAGRVGLYAERIAYHFLESDDDAKALEYSIRAGDKILRTYYDSDLALGYYLAALEMVVGKEPSLRHLRAKSPVPIRRGALHRFTAEERDAVVAYLGDILQASRETPVARAVAQLASRICVVSMHTGEVYEASVRLYEQCLLGPDVKKLVVETARGKLVGILEFPGPGGPYPVVLMFHGSAGSKEVLADPAQVFLARGLATLRIDLPGFGETTVPVTGSPADAEILKEMVTAILAQDRVDSRGVGVIGWSLGPWHAAHLCARDDRVRAMAGMSGTYNPLEGLPGVAVPEALTRAFFMARWKAGARPSPDPIAWSPDAPVYTVASQIRCPMLLVYGALEPELYRVTAEKLAALVPTAKTQVWRTGVHSLRNIPEALEHAADWMKQQLLGQNGAP